MLSKIRQTFNPKYRQQSLLDTCPFFPRERGGIFAGVRLDKGGISAI